MRFKSLHRWPRSVRAAIELQRRLARHNRLEPVDEAVRLLAGVDVGFSRDGRDVIAGIVLWDAAARAVVEQVVARRPCTFPYVPGLLSFREIPAFLSAARKLRTRPDVFLCDGQGYAHPRRFGLACHLGMSVDAPSVGCAKSRLCGTHAEPATRRGSGAPLLDGGEQIGVVLRTRDGVKPLYVSAGFRCDLESAARITLLATTRFRLPEPTRLAHQLVCRARKAAEANPQPGQSRDREGAEVERVEQPLPYGRGSERWCENPFSHPDTVARPSSRDMKLSDNPVRAATVRERR